VKLLVATEFPPNASGGGPAIVRQMLRNRPARDSFWWSCLPDRDQRFGQKVANHFCATIPSKLLPHRRLTRVKSALLDWFWTPFASTHLKEAIRQVQPDVIWAIPHNWSIIPLESSLPTSGIGFHLTMQDYVDVHGQETKFGIPRCRRMAAAADRLYAAATTRDATSHPMIEDLQRRTGAKAAQMLHAGLEREDFDFIAHKDSRCRNSSTAIKIAYAGTILVEHSFELFVSAIKEIRKSLPRRVELHLFGAHSYAQRKWFDSEWIIEDGNLPEEELLKNLRVCDWGFAPMALNDKDPRYNRFSFPTKFITYLAAGLPIITVGHPESSLTKMARQYEVGLCTSAMTLDELASDLMTLLSAQEPFDKYKAEIIRCATNEFDVERMRRTLSECFEKCTNQTIGPFALRSNTR
jgi:Glycosyl transferases group 1